MGRKYFKFGRKDTVLNFREGMTLTEALVAVAILGLLLIVTLSLIRPNLQLGRSRDKRRIADLRKISVSLEDYAGDNNCYPEQIYTSENVCQATAAFGYYLKNIPCDPQTRNPYTYIRIDGCKQYVIYATLELEKEQDYGYGNYYLSSENVKGVPTISPSSDIHGIFTTGTPVPTSSEGEFNRYYSCINHVCTPISSPDLCDFNFINLSQCTGDECCRIPDIENPCSYPQYQCQK